MTDKKGTKPLKRYGGSHSLPYLFLVSLLLPLAVLAFILLGMSTTTAMLSVLLLSVVFTGCVICFVYAGRVGQ